MKHLGNEIGSFIVAIYNSWVALMCGIFSVTVWAIAAFLAPLPLSLRWTFLVCGAIALLVACFQVWRTEYRTRLNGKARLKLLRLIDNGERLIAGLEQSTAAQQINGIQAGVVGLNRWQKECEQTLQMEYDTVWEHFSDLSEADPRQSEERAQRFIQRMRDVLEVLSKP